ncbi:MAG: hypothetical protein WCQ21_18260 [Verrucomicrobiota bacterium]|jgi:hypothetical protein
MQRLTSIFKTLVAFWALQGWASENKPLAEPLSDKTRPAVVQSMFFKPCSQQTGAMWDTWLYYQEGMYYLYHLAGPLSPPAFHGVALATSPDGVHWTERGVVLPKARDVVWMGSGSVWKSCNFEKDKKFIMNFSEWRGPDGRQSIFFAESTDLVHWERLGNECEFKQDPRWYRRDGYWDAIYTVPRDGGGRYGYWSSQPKGFVGVGFGQTSDGTHWEALEPPKIEWGKFLHLSLPDNVAVGAVEKIGNNYYMMLGTSAGGMFTFVAERPQGPFRPAERNIQLLSNKNNTFSRFFPTPGAMLVNHHAWTRNGAVYFPVLKQAVVDERAALRLKWWKGNEKLKHEAIEVRIPAPTTAVAMLGKTFDTRRGLILEGSVVLPASKDVARVGVYIEHSKDSGTAVLVDTNGATEFGAMRQDGSNFEVDDRLDREATLPRTCRFRLLLKFSLIEFYLDDQMIQCYSLPGEPTGRIGFIAGGRPEAFRDLQAWYDMSSAASETSAVLANPPGTWLTYHLAHWSTL